MNITLPFMTGELRAQAVTIPVNGRTWRGFFGVPIEENALAAHPFGKADREIMPILVFDQGMADRVRRSGEGFEFSL